MRVGVAGLGRMGAAIAQRLIETGFEVVVWNRSAERMAPLVAKGATAASSPAALAGSVDVTVTILTDQAAIAAVYDGPVGLIKGLGTGRLAIDMSTVRPETEKALAARVTATGAGFVECPVGGTVGPALKGQLLGFAGGTAADFTTARPVLEKLCRKVDHVGDVGAGSSIKLAINLPLIVYWQALGESYALCKHLGIDPQSLVGIFQETSGATNALKARGETVAKALAGADIGPGLFDCDGLRKDLRTMIEEARGLGYADLPVASATLKVFDAAAADGWGNHDGMQMPTYWSGRKG